MLTGNRFAPQLLFAAAAIGIYGIALYLRAILPSLEAPGVMAMAITVDLVLVVPALWYVLVVRRKGWSWLSVVPVFIASLLLASRVVPSDHHRTLTVLEFAAIPLELGLLAFIGWKAAGAIRRMRAQAGGVDADALAAFRVAAGAAVSHPRVAHMVAYELSVLYYGLVSWFRRRPQDASCEFTSHHRDAYASVLVGLFMVLAIEIFPVHVLLHNWNPIVAWVVTAVSVYSAIWILGDFQAFRERPIRVTADALYLRAGLRWDVVIPRERIREIRHLAAEPEAVDPGALQMKVINAPNMRLRTDGAVRVQGLYGLERRSDDIYFTLDDPAGFLSAWNALEPTPVD